MIRKHLEPVEPDGTFLIENVGSNSHGFFQLFKGLSSFILQLFSMEPELLNRGVIKNFGLIMVSSQVPQVPNVSNNGKFPGSTGSKCFQIMVSSQVPQVK